MRRGVWLIVALLALVAAACSGGAAAPTTVLQNGPSLAGVEVVVHQAPG